MADQPVAGHFVTAIVQIMHTMRVSAAQRPGISSYQPSIQCVTSSASGQDLLQKKPNMRKHFSQIKVHIASSTLMFGARGHRAASVGWGS